MEKNTCRLGYYFARTDSTGNLTTVGCFADKIIKEEKEDVEILERIPLQTIQAVEKNGVKILNLARILKRMR